MGLEIPGRTPPGTRRSSRGRGAALVTVGVLMTVALGGCSKAQDAQIGRLAQPQPASKEAPYMLHLWMWSWLAAIIVGVIVWGLIIYAVIRFRRRSDDELPVQTRYNLPIEIFYTIAPVIMVVVFFFYTVKTQNEVLHDFAHPDHTVEVVGQQWSWTFNYLHEPAVGGKTTYDVGNTAYEPTLWLVKDQTVEFHLYSPDVIHSFWVPAFLFKMDVVPGRDNHFGITPDRYGTFVGRCAELCGVYHSEMLFNVKVVSKAAFDKHLQHLVKIGQVGLARGGSMIRQQPGLESTSTGGSQ